MTKGGLTGNSPAVYMLVRQDGKLLFVKRANTGFMDGFYSLPAGRVEPGERYRPAAIREAQEEVGVTVQPAGARQVYTQQRYGKSGEDIWIDVFFEAGQWSGTPVNGEPEVHSEIAWFSLDDLPEYKIMNYQLAAIRGILAGETYGEFGWPEQAREGQS